MEIYKAQDHEHTSNDTSMKCAVVKQKQIRLTTNAPANCGFFMLAQPKRIIITKGTMTM